MEPPAGSSLKSVSVGRHGIWVLDSSGQLSVRCEVTNVFPEGTHWQTIPPLDLDHSGKDKLLCKLDTYMVVERLLTLWFCFVDFT